MNSSIGRNNSPSRQLENASSELDRFLWSRGEKLPKILVLVTECKDFSLLEATLRRIPQNVLEIIDEITVFDVFTEEDAGPVDHLKSLPAWEKLRFFSNPRRYDYGDNLKNCFDYAIAKGFDYVVVLRGDAAYDPASLPLFLASALSSGCPAVIGDRMGGTASPPRRWTGSFKLAANRLLSFVEETILRMKLRDYHCGFRLLST
ncbi:hypothetical protein ACFL2Q_18980, partial [Thermodesulfobacteriota bacterium]